MPIRGTRGTLWVALLCAGALGEAMATPEGPIASGQAGYWVKLQGLHASEGSMDPPFTEDGKEFTLRVENSKVKSLAITFELNLQKYDPLELPKIFINDHEFEYSPVDVLKYEIPLDETIASIDQVYRIKIADPAGPVGWPFPHENAHEYALRVLQAPVYDKVVEAVGIDVRSMDGNQIKADKDFDPAERTYHYSMPGESSAVKLDVQCTPYATGMVVDGVDVPVNETQTVVMEHVITQVNVQCQYANPKYTSTVQAKTYALKLERSVRLESFNVALKISAEEGYCAMREMVQDGGHNDTTGFICRSAVAEPTFLAIYSNPRVEVVLVGRDSGMQHSLPHGVAVPIKISDKQSKYTLKVLGSAEPLEFPVEVIRAASCSTLQCGTGKLHRKGLLAVEAAQAHLCLKEVCTAEDEDRCCEDAPACETMEEAWCPSGTVLLRDGARCAHGPCSDEDKAACCKKPHPRTTTAATPAGEERSTTAVPPDGSGRGGQRTRLRHHTPDATMKKIAFYQELGCWPNPSSSCNGAMCVFDESCLQAPPRNGGLGCWAAGISGACRFCGFGIYEECPKFYDCSGSCHAWAPEHRAWCFQNYGVRCPQLLHRVQFWQNESIAGLSAVTHQIVDSLGGASEQHLGAAATFLGLAAFAAAFAASALVWRLACGPSGPRAREGMRHQMLPLGEEQADFIE